MSRIENEQFLVNMNLFEILTSSNSNIIIIKLNLQKGSFEDIRNELNNLLNKDYFAQTGVYFLRLKDGYYIGETQDLNTRLQNHIENREVRSITLSTYKSDIDRMDKENIRDLESILIQYAQESGLTIGDLLENKKEENRKIKNSISAIRSETVATFIWEGIRQLNINDLWEDLVINRELKQRPIIEKEIPRKQTNIFNDIAEEISPSIRSTSEELNSFRDVANVANHMVDENLEIFKYVPYRKDVANGYNSTRIEIFTKDKIRRCLEAYLYNKISNGKVDIEITNGKRNRGWLTAATLAYYRIETNGLARGSLSGLSNAKALELIDELINKS